MRTNSFALFVGLLVSACAVEAASVSRVIVRQQWPWQGAVKIEYLLTGASDASPVDMTVTCYNGTRELTDYDFKNALSGDVYDIRSDGDKTIMLDTARAFGTDTLKMSDFRVVLKPVASQVTDPDEEFYRIYDLTSTTKPIPYVSVTRADLLNQRYGRCETDYSKLGEGFSSPLDEVFVWTGVTNDIAYKTDKLVMRRIKAKNVTWTMGSPESETGRVANRELQRQVILTNDYLIGVFEVTRAQYAKYHNVPLVEDATTHGDVAMTQAGYGYEILCLQGWDCQDGSASSGEKFNWPTNKYRHVVRYNRMLGKMRTATGIKFYLPTQAQWEYACRAGSTSGLYNGLELTTVGAADPAQESIAWTEYSGISEVQRVGRKAPNAWGLYDMLGNVSEWCLDWANPNMDVAYTFDYGTRTTFEHSAPVIDPVGPGEGSENQTESKAYYRSRVVRGGNWESGNQIKCRSAYRDTGTTQSEYAKGGATAFAKVGFRLVAPIGADWDQD